MLDGAAPATAPTWMRRALLLAAAYNLLWGGFVMLFPATPFLWLRIAPPATLALWQCVGMMVAVYGVGYAAAAQHPLRHWPITLVGLLGKVLGPVGFCLAVARGELPLRFFWLIALNDLPWWIPFARILVAARARHDG